MDFCAVPRGQMGGGITQWLGYWLDSPGLESRYGQTSSGAHPASYSMSNRDSFPDVKRQGNKVNHSLQFIQDVKNAWSCASNPLLRSWRGQGQCYTSKLRIVSPILPPLVRPARPLSCLLWQNPKIYDSYTCQTFVDCRNVSFWMLQERCRIVLCECDHNALETVLCSGENQIAYDNFTV
jgi:hypothetical protein